MPGTEAAPSWAHELIDVVVQEYGIKKPELVWTWDKKNRLQSGGNANGFRININAGTDVQDQHGTLLHELAHVIVIQRDKNRGHNQGMYEVAWDLWERYMPNFDPQYHMKREGWYKTTCLTVARKRGFAGADDALKERKQINAVRCKSHYYIAYAAEFSGWAYKTRRLKDGTSAYEHQAIFKTEQSCQRCGAWSITYRMLAKTEIKKINPQIPDPPAATGTVRLTV